MSHPAFDLSGQSVIVTGGGRGLGRGMALAFAEAGAKVLVGARSADELNQTVAMIEKAGGVAMAHIFDARSPEDCRRLVEAAAQRFGRLDAMIVNHGVAFAGAAEAVAPEDWNETMAINLTGCWNCAQAAGRAMIAQGKGGSIVLISSTGSLRAFPEIAAYDISKAGVDQMARQLSSEWGRYEIRVNAVNPGYTENHMRGGDARHEKPEVEAHIRARTPLERRGTIAEIAAPVLFLCSPAAAFVSGVVLPVDGGYCAR